MAAPRRATFTFDLSKPLKKGALLKQGAFHRAFKSREFILYPGFLVYYETENRWRLDLTKGETLGGRLGAVKLKGATVGIARDAPKACKFGVMLTAPDPANKRQTYLMNASSKGERDSWIEAIRKAAPNSPQMQRVDKPAQDKPKPAESKPSSGEKNLPPPPAYTLRQDTACEAAVAAASCTDEKEELQAINEMIANVNSSLKESEIDNALHRHNTATLAAITLGVVDSLENGLDEIAEHETSIDMALGKREDRRTSSDGSSSNFSDSPGTTSPTSKVEPDTPDAVSPDCGESMAEKELLSPDPETPHEMTPDPEEAMEMEMEETVNSSEDGIDGKSVVTTVVTVAVSTQGSSPDQLEGEDAGKANGTQEDREENGQKEEEEDNIKGNRARSSSSTQILVTDHENTTLSVNLNAYDSDDTLSDEESHEDLLENENKTATENGPAENVTAEKIPSPQHSPVIAIKEDRTGSGSSHGSNASSGSNGMSKLTAPENQRRRTSTPFVEKRGFLYKMGGQRKTWKLRYFIVRPGAFNYFKDSRAHKPLGEVKLKNLSIFFPGIGERKQSFQFTLHTESSWNKRADYVFAGQSEREMKEWITAFKLAGQKVGSVGPDDSDD